MNGPPGVTAYGRCNEIFVGQVHEYACPSPQLSSLHEKKDAGNLLGHPPQCRCPFRQRIASDQRKGQNSPFVSTTVRVERTQQMPEKRFRGAYRGWTDEMHHGSDEGVSAPCSAITERLKLLEICVWVAYAGSEKKPANQDLADPERSKGCAQKALK